MNLREDVVVRMMYPSASDGLNGHEVLGRVMGPGFKLDASYDPPPGPEGLMREEADSLAHPVDLPPGVRSLHPALQVLWAMQSGRFTPWPGEMVVDESGGFGPRVSQALWGGAGRMTASYSEMPVDDTTGSRTEQGPALPPHESPTPERRGEGYDEQAEQAGRAWWEATLPGEAHAEERTAYPGGMNPQDGVWTPDGGYIPPGPDHPVARPGNPATPPADGSVSGQGAHPKAGANQVEKQAGKGLPQDGRNAPAHTDNRFQTEAMKRAADAQRPNSVADYIDTKYGKEPGTIGNVMRTIRDWLRDDTSSAGGPSNQRNRPAGGK